MVVFESIKKNRGRGDQLIAGEPNDTKTSIDYPNSCSIDKPEPDKVDFYNKKTFTLTYLNLQNSSLEIWGICDWEVVEKYGYEPLPQPFRCISKDGIKRAIREHGEKPF
jgi:hypothetical protein